MTIAATSEAIEDEAAALSASVESALIDLLVAADKNISERSDYEQESGLTDGVDIRLKSGYKVGDQRDCIKVVPLLDRVRYWFGRWSGQNAHEGTGQG